MLLKKNVNRTLESFPAFHKPKQNPPLSLFRGMEGFLYFLRAARKPLDLDMGMKASVRRGRGVFNPSRKYAPLLLSILSNNHCKIGNR
ncbi:hypothetical protein SAMN06264849_11212 [Melghirimyces algeriensis]|uniref:Uncharacterized protein n=1 Tax=Melghirimyces algeriensis TaxID=910412 RepID=A0A521F2R7_9BACL|nr:hypothetical protein SAMN06264849_11212 [Melghirimyces algeriensis]